MAFNMNGVFIEAIVENGLGTFSIGSNNAFVNSIESLTMKTVLGGVSEITVNLTPTFTQAIEIIESGFLGFGHPIQSQSNVPSISNLIAGVAVPLSATPSPGATASSLSVRLGYSDGDPKSLTPWTRGMITAPKISMGPEIQITINATSTIARDLLNADTVRSFRGENLYDVTKKIVEQDSKGVVNFEQQAKSYAQGIKLDTNQVDNGLSFIQKTFHENGLKGYFSGGTKKFPQEQFNVTSISAMSNKTPMATLRLFGQIDVNNNVYPMLSFETDITHTQIAGAGLNSKATFLSIDDKKISKVLADTDTYKAMNKVMGGTVPSKNTVGKATNNGATDGPPDPRDLTKAGKRVMLPRKNANDKIGENAIKNNSDEVRSSAIVMTVTCPLLPFLNPSELVNIEVMTGNPDRPIFKTVSGVYRINIVTHTVGPDGGNTQLELLREIGAVPSGPNLPRVQNAVQDQINGVTSKAKSIFGGIVK